MIRLPLLLPLVAVLVGCSPPPTAAPPPPTATPADAKAAAEVDAVLARVRAESPPPGPADPVTAWTYTSARDPMTDKPTREACVRSTNEANLAWPYHPVTALLCLRDSPQWGRDVYVRLDGDGQILCTSYSRCNIRVRFGDGPPAAFSGTDAADHSSNIVFITNRARFERGLARAGTTIVQLEFYQAGAQALTFPTAGFKWPTPAASGSAR